MKKYIFIILSLIVLPVYAFSQDINVKSGALTEKFQSERKICNE